MTGTRTRSRSLQEALETSRRLFKARRERKAQRGFVVEARRHVDPVRPGRPAAASVAADPERESRRQREAQQSAEISRLLDEAGCTRDPVTCTCAFCGN